MYDLAKIGRLCPYIINFSLPERRAKSNWNREEEISHRFSHTFGAWKHLELIGPGNRQGKDWRIVHRLSLYDAKDILPATAIRVRGGRVIDVF